MSDGTGIAWTDATWSPILGCAPKGPGCLRCYARRDVWRMAHNPNPKISGPRAGLVEKTCTGELRWTGKVSLLPEQLPVPLRWRKGRRVFVANQSDLFHEGVPDQFIAAVFGVMAAAPRHTFQVLTKRPDRALRWFAWLDEQRKHWSGPGSEKMECDWRVHAVAHAAFEATGYEGEIGPLPEQWPLPNVHVGFSGSTQKDLDEGVPDLLRIPAALHYLSLEPLVERVDLDMPRCETHDREFVATHEGEEICNECAADGWSGELSFGHWLDPLNGGIGWVIIGGESDVRPRPLEVEWARAVVDQCRRESVPVFVKQLGAWWAKTQDGFPDPKGGDPEEWPEDLRVRQMPEVADA